MIQLEQTAVCYSGTYINYLVKHFTKLKCTLPYISIPDYKLEIIYIQIWSWRLYGWHWSFYLLLNLNASMPVLFCQFIFLFLQKPCDIVTFKFGLLNQVLLCNTMVPAKGVLGSKFRHVWFFNGTGHVIAFSFGNR